jgi:putative ABC transport system substrate-binding protein
MSFGGEDPVAAGWAQSYAHPGKNVTGVVMLSPELDGKRFHVLHEAFPTRRRVAVLFHTLAKNVPDDRFTRHVQAAARSSGVELLIFYASGGADYESVFAPSARLIPMPCKSGPRQFSPMTLVVSQS